MKEPASLGMYRLIRKLGEGGMGIVYEGLHEGIERQVAIKLLSPLLAFNKEAVSRFLNEAKAVNKIRHPGIVEITDFGQSAEGTPYLVMEYLDGETLAQRLERQGGRLPLSEVYVLAEKIAAALSAAHSCGVIHRDLKPQNIMIIPGVDRADLDRVKIFDFGIAKLAAALSASATSETALRTKSGMVLGTPAYMAPEQCREAGTVDPKADVYSLGVILYEVVSGRVPFSGGLGDILTQHILAEPPPLVQVEKTVPERLARLVHKMLRKDPASRPSMEQVAREVAEAAPATQKNTGAPDIKRAASRKNSAPTHALLILGLVCIVILAWVSRRGIGETLATKKQVWSIVSEPKGANLIRAADGAVIGQTPFLQEQEQTRTGSGEIFYLKSKGYSPVYFSCVRGSACALSLTLPLEVSHDNEPEQRPRPRPPALWRPF